MNHRQRIMLSKDVIVIESPEPRQISSTRNSAAVGAMLKTIAAFGYSFTQKAIDRLSSFSKPALAKIYTSVVDMLDEASTGGVSYDSVFYKNFPEIRDIPDCEMYLNAVLHYLTVGINDYITDEGEKIPVYMPEYRGRAKLPFDETHKPRLLDIAFYLDPEDRDMIDGILVSHFKNTFAANVAIPYASLDDLESLYRDYAPIPDAIPFKENVIAYFGMVAKREGPEFDWDKPFPFMDTATDYLRLYRMLSANDHRRLAEADRLVNQAREAAYSTSNRAAFDQARKHYDTLVAYSNKLAAGEIFTSLPKKARRWFLDGLNRACLKHFFSTMDDLHADREDWIHALEKLHPGQYARRYPCIASTAKYFRSKQYTTWNASVERRAASGDTSALAEKLVEKPGYFARALDRFLRSPSTDASVILTAFESCVDSVSSTLLVQLLDHFAERASLGAKPARRVFRIKGKTAGKADSLATAEDNRAPIDPAVIASVTSIIRNSLRRRAAANPELAGKRIYASPSMANYPAPRNDRHASKAIRMLPSGTAIPIKGDESSADTVRAFTHWRNIDTDSIHGGRVDIDISAIVLSSSFEVIAEGSWRNPAGCRSIGLLFSGDITDAPRGATEYIDVNIAEISAACPNARYVAICNTVFTGQPFGSIPECFSGAMLRSSGGRTGEAFEPSSECSFFELTQDSTAFQVSAIVDLETLMLIYADMPLDEGCSNRVAAKAAIGAAVAAMMRPSTSVLDLAKLAAEGLGTELAEDPSSADIVISDGPEATIRPWEAGEIAKHLLP